MGQMASNQVNQMAFCPPQPTYQKKDVNMWLETDRGSRIPAFHIRRPGNKLTVLVSHANAEDLGVVLSYWSWLSEALSVDVFAYEYSGYGHSEGEKPCEQAMYSDARAAIALLRDGFKLKPERDVVVYGKSLGSCPTSYLASKHLVRGVIIVCGLASGARVLFPQTKLWPVDALYFNNLGHLGANKSPVQLIHGTADDVVPFSSGLDLHACCKARGVACTAHATARRLARPCMSCCAPAARRTTRCRPAGSTAPRTTTSSRRSWTSTCACSAPSSRTSWPRRPPSRPRTAGGSPASREPSASARPAQCASQRRTSPPRPPPRPSPPRLPTSTDHAARLRARSPPVRARRALEPLRCAMAWNRNDFVDRLKHHHPLTTAHTFRSVRC